MAPSRLYRAEIEVLDGIAAVLAEAADPVAAVKPTLEILDNQFGMRYATLTLLDADAGETRIDMAIGLDDRQIDHGRYRLGEGITGSVVASGRPMVIFDPESCPEFLDRTNRGGREDASFICVPVIIGKEILGTLSAEVCRKPEVELWNDARMLGVVAAMLALAIRTRHDAQQRQADLIGENRRLRRELRDRSNSAKLVGKSPEMRAVFDRINHVAATYATVLLHGETGTGKELVAEAIHYNGNRADKPFIRVNCAALPESLIESELFGHEKGSFTGASATRKGRFEEADGGTLFIDEVGDLPPLVQVKLLRVLQERTIERVGSNETRRVDVRIIAATHRDLFAMSRDERFRSDLFYRINVFPINLPPLRQRRDDIPLLAEKFLRKYAALAGKSVTAISPAVMEIFDTYSWPGNVRELENAVEYAVILAMGDVIEPEHLPANLRLPPEMVAETGDTGFEALVENYERGLIVNALRATQGNINKAAALLKATPRVIAYRVKRLGIDLSHAK